MKSMPMRLIPVVLIAVALLLTGCCAIGKCRKRPACAASAGKTAVNPESKDAEIDTLALQTLITSGVPLTILDARTGKYDDGRRIPGAKGLGAQSTSEEVEAVVKSKDALIVAYCSNLKCPASRMLAKRLKELGYKNVLEYPKGIAGWTEAGNGVEKAK